MTRRISTLILALLTLILAGCGGFGSSGTPHEKVPAFVVNWPKLEREFNAPQNADRAYFTVLSGNSVATSAVLYRDANIAAHSATITMDSPIPVGSYGLKVSFYSGPSSFIAEAKIPFDLKANGNVVGFDGKPLGSIGFTTRIKKLLVSVGSASVLSGASNFLFFAGQDIDGQNLAISAGGLKIASQSGPGHLDFASDFSAVVSTSGADTLTFSVDGVSSDSVSLQLYHAAFATTKVSALTTNTVTGDLWALTTNLPQKLVRLNSTDGSVSTSIDLPAAASGIRFSADGAVAYVFGSSSLAVFKIDLAAGTVASTINVPNPALAFGTCLFVDLAISTADNDVFAVSFQEIGSSGNGYATIVDHGTALPGQLGTYDGTSLCYTQADQMIVGAPGFSPSQARLFQLDSNGFASPIVQNSTAADRYVLAGGKVYGSNATIYTPSTFASEGSYDGAYFGSLCVRPDLNRIMFGSAIVTLFDLTTHAKLNAVDFTSILATNPGGPGISATLCGAGIIAASDGIKLALVATG